MCWIYEYDYRLYNVNGYSTVLNVDSRGLFINDESTQMWSYSYYPIWDHTISILDIPFSTRQTD